MRTFAKTNTLLALTVLCVSFLFACKDEKKKEKTVDQASNSSSSIAAPADTPINPSGQPAAAAIPQTAGPYSVLKLDRQALKDLFVGSTQKLLIQFSDQGTNRMQAVAFAAKKNNVYENVLKNLTPASNASWDTTGVKILGNNELTEKQIKKLIGGAIKDNAKDLYFYPIKDAMNQMYFIVSTTLMDFKTPGKDIMLGYPDGESTKPSPPAPPCTTCD